MRIILLTLVSFTAVACMPHKFDVHYRKDSEIFKEKINHVQKNNKIKIEKHKLKSEEIKSVNQKIIENSSIPKNITLETSDYPNHLLLNNKSSEDLFVEFEKSSIIKNNLSYRVVSGETLNRNINLTVPDQIVAANSTAKISFYISELPTDSSYRYDKLIISFRVGNQRHRIERFGELSKFPSNLEENPDTYLGRISYLNKTEKYLCGFTFWLFGGFCWFILNADESDFHAAEEIAEKKFKIPSEEIFLTEVSSSKSVILSDIIN